MSENAAQAAENLLKAYLKRTNGVAPVAPLVNKETPQPLQKTRDTNKTVQPAPAKPSSVA